MLVMDRCSLPNSRSDQLFFRPKKGISQLHFRLEDVAYILASIPYCCEWYYMHIIYIVVRTLSPFIQNWFLASFLSVDSVFCEKPIFTTDVIQ